MYTNSILAATGALLSLVVAVPMADQHHHHHAHPNKRDYVWVTHTEQVIKTIPVTHTVWVEPGEETPAVRQGKHHGKPPAAYAPSSSTSSAAPYVAPASTPEPYVAPSSSPEPYVAPASSPEPYVAPASSSSSSVYVAPAPTTPTSTYVAPAATTPAVYEAPASSSAAPAAPASYSSSGSGLSSGMGASGTSYSGDLTWYEVGLGACGLTNVASDKVVAISHEIFDSYSTGNPNTNPLCGKFVTITGADGSPYEGKIVDRCPGCTQGSLDLSQDFFNAVTNYGDGRVGGMEWSFA